MVSNGIFHRTKDLSVDSIFGVFVTLLFLGSWRICVFGEWGRWMGYDVLFFWFYFYFLFFFGIFLLSLPSNEVVSELHESLNGR